MKIVPIQKAMLHTYLRERSLRFTALSLNVRFKVFRVAFEDLLNQAAQACDPPMVGRVSWLSDSELYLLLLRFAAKLKEAEKERKNAMDDPAF